MDTQLVTTSTLATILCSLNFLVHAQDQVPDFSCSRYTASGDVQLVGGETITVIADTLQSITCINNTVEIEHIGYDFIPTNAVVRKKEDYVSPHKHELKVFLNHSTTLIVRGLNSITANDADYTLEIKVNVEGLECSLALSSFNTSHTTVNWTFVLLATLWYMCVNMLR